MFKRTFWLLVGTMLGLGGSIWAQRRLRQQIERYAPERVARRMSSAVQELGREVKAAAAEGRKAMLAREAELQAQFRPPA